MSSNIEQLITGNDPQKIESYVQSLSPNAFSLQSLIDSLIKPLVWESNLDFGSFHLIKMALFLRDLSRQHFFSIETERALATAVLKHLALMDHIRIEAAMDAHVPDPIDNALTAMLEEIEEGNVHNAYLYATVAYKKDRPALMNALLSQGALSISDSLGHSISCFFPVVDHLLASDHDMAGTTLLSFIMYLCRFRQPSKQPVSAKADALTPAKKNSILKKAVQGTGIVELHHMITFYIFQAWENADWNEAIMPDWQGLSDWIGEKKEASATQDPLKPMRSMPATYESFAQLINERDAKAIVPVVLKLVETSSKQAHDWLFRAYADSFNPDWDPHYFTGLYAALKLHDDDSLDLGLRRQALQQALHYFLENID